MERLMLKPIRLHEAEAFLTARDESLDVVYRCEFSVGCYASRTLVGAAVVDRPRTNWLDDGWTLELSRISALDRAVETKLVAGATQAAFALGTRRMLAYRLAEPEGASYRAAGWTRIECVERRWERYNLASLDDLRKEAA